MNDNNSFRQPPTSTSPHPQLAGVVNTPAANLHTWNFKYVSQMDHKVYEGQFTCRKLSVMQLSRLGVRKTQLNGGFHYDENNPGQGVEEHIDSMNSMVAHLEIALIQAPVWFNLDEIVDPMLLQMVYREVAKFENNFFRSQGGMDQPGPRITNDSGGQSAPTGSAGLAAPVGGNEVPPSMDP